MGMILEQAAETAKASQLFVEKSLDFSKRLSDALRDRSMSQKQLADKLDVSEARVSYLLAGRANPTLKTIAKIEAVLGVDLNF